MADGKVVYANAAVKAAPFGGELKRQIPPSATELAHSGWS